MIQPLFEHRLTFGGYKTRVLELEGDGPPILMFHGYADSADTWRQSLALLARRGHRAIAVDLPGFGEADRVLPGTILPQLDAFAADAAAYAADHPRRPVIAVGNSLGGCVALRLAQHHRRRLAGVVAVAPAGLAMSRLLFLVERDPVLRSILAVPSPVPGAIIRAAVARLYRRIAFAAPGAVDDTIVSAFTWRHRHRAAVAGYLAFAHRLLPELREPFELGLIRTPVLVIWGDRDRLVFHRGAQKILDTVPGARLELLPGVGHCPQVEAPARFTELLLEFAGDPAPAVTGAG